MPVFRCELGIDSLPRPDAAFSLVTMIDVAYHITDDDQWSRALREVARVLRAGGALIATDGFGTADVPAEAHVRFRSTATWEAAVEEVDLRLRFVRPLYGWLSRGRRSSRLVVLPDGLRGALEYTLEHALPRPAHLRCATIVKER
jgi:SAM-dependent methyltransferase